MCNTQLAWLPLWGQEGICTTEPVQSSTHCRRAVASAPGRSREPHRRGGCRCDRAGYGDHTALDAAIGFLAQAR
jgi:hypothetical protein